MSKISKPADRIATKRDVNKAMKESANLWEALTDVETKMNVVVGHLLAVQRDANELELFHLAACMTIEQAEKLRCIRAFLEEYDKGPLFKQATDD